MQPIETKAYFSAVKRYIKNNALKMLRPGGGGFRYPFIDPGAGYENNLWDWDSFWSAKALFEVCEYFRNDDDFSYQAVRKRVVRHARGSILNFFALQQEDGFIPMVATADEASEPFLTRQYRSDQKVNQHKPFLCQGVLNASRATGDYFWFSAEPLKKYLAFYEAHQFDPVSGLYFWRNDIMIGIDNNPTVFGFPEDSCADIYLNSFLYAEFSAMADLLECRGEDGAGYRQKAECLKHAVRSELYDRHDDLYYSAYLDIKTRQTENYHHGLGVFWKCIPLKIRIWACLLPIVCGIATKEEGEQILRRHYFDENISCEFGIRTLAGNEKMYNTEPSSNPSNWLGPVWIIANYCTWRALKAAGLQDAAREMTEKTVRLLGSDIIKNNAMSESYVPETGEPMLYGGFLNWNVLAIEMIGDYEQG